MSEIRPILHGRWAAITDRNVINTLDCYSAVENTQFSDLAHSDLVTKVLR